MKLLFKISGIILIFACAVLLGLFKSFSKKDYINRLKKTVLSLEAVDNMLRLGAQNREKILSQCFDDTEILSSPESDLLEAFFRDFGSGDIKTEHQRIERFKEELSAKICKEETEYKTSGRLWRTAGICAGFAAAIMLI